jgi:peroxiredoxin
VSKAISRPAAQRPKQWWSKRRNRNKVWLVLVAGLVAVAVGLFAYFATRGMDSPKPLAAGQQVESFQLPEVISGKTFSLADYLGKKDIVLVSYMGFFCVGCDELLVELQGRQVDFAQRDAQLVVLGSLPESMDTAKNDAEQRGLTYPLVYDAETNVTKKLGLWSDMMEMPWMGYMIIDKSGQVAGSDLQLSEAKGAAPANVDEILAALQQAQQAEASGSQPQATP